LTRPPMLFGLVSLLVVLVAPLVGCAAPKGVIIAHRGANWHLPEHTLPAYALAHGMGAGMIEPDVVVTRDGVLICAHDLTMETTTDVAEVFPGRARADGKWYWVDFDLAEIRTLRAFGRGPARDPGYGVATLDEMVTLVQRLDARAGRTTGIIPEIKHPAFHTEHGFDLAGMLVDALARHGYSGARDAAVIQCFDLPTLKHLHASGCRLRLVWLIGEEPNALDVLRASEFCHGIGPSRKLIEDGAGRGTDLLARARQYGLAVYPYTFKDEPEAVLRFLKEHRAEGVFCDDPAVLTR
jgi:glycerophosphoryl diester phosphodiesterase